MEVHHYFFQSSPLLLPKFTIISASNFFYLTDAFNSIKDISINNTINDIKDDIMKHILTKEPKEIKEDAPIKKATEYSYRVTLPKKVIEMFPELKDDAKMVFEIKQINLNEYECDITFKVKGMTIADMKEPAETQVQTTENIKEPASTIDKTKKKIEKKPSNENDKRTDSNKKINPDDFDDVTTPNGIYTIKVSSRQRPILYVKKDSEKIDNLGVSSKSVQTVQEIINRLIEANPNEDTEIYKILNDYRAKRHHKPK